MESALIAVHDIAIEANKELRPLIAMMKRLAGSTIVPNFDKKLFGNNLESVNTACNVVDMLMDTWKSTKSDDNALATMMALSRFLLAIRNCSAAIHSYAESINVICPILQTPVGELAAMLGATGDLYNPAALKRWFAQSNRDPLSNRSLYDKRYFILPIEYAIKLSNKRKAIIKDAANNQTLNRHINYILAVSIYQNLVAEAQGRADFRREWDNLSHKILTWYAEYYYESASDQDDDKSDNSDNSDDQSDNDSNQSENSQNGEYQSENNQNDSDRREDDGLNQNSDNDSQSDDEDNEKADAGIKAKFIRQKWDLILNSGCEILTDTVGQFSLAKLPLMCGITNSNIDNIKKYSFDNFDGTVFAEQHVRDVKFINVDFAGCLFSNIKFVNCEFVTTTETPCVGFDSSTIAACMFDNCIITCRSGMFAFSSSTPDFAKELENRGAQIICCNFK